MVKVALLIGVGEYGNGLSPLPAASKDAAAMQKVLENQEIGGFDQVILLINPERQEMEEAIFNLFTNRKKDDLVLLFFSGHGIKDDSGNLYLAARNTRKEQEALVKPTAVAASYVQKTMSDSRSRHQVIILDCCFSGAFAEGMKAKDDGSVSVKQQLGGEGRAVLTSSTSTQYSFELPGFDLSIYTHYLVEGINTGVADRDNDGHVSVDELHEYACEKVQETAPAKMKPEIYPVKEGAKILLAKVQVDDPKVIYRKEAELRVRDGDFSIVARKLLNFKRENLGLLIEEAEAIEAEVLKPFREYEANLQQYKRLLSEQIEHEFPLSDTTRNDLKDLQQHLGLKDEDVALIENQVIPVQESVDTNEDEFLIETASFSSNSFLAGNERILDQEINSAIKSSNTESPIDNLNTNLSIDYGQLREFLSTARWKEADQETKAIILQLSAREVNSQLEAEDFRKLPYEDLHIIDQLWQRYSNGRFGLIVQQRIWQSIGGSKGSGYEAFKRFGDYVGWSVGGNWRNIENLIFNLNAPEGHLPYCRAWLYSRRANAVVSRFSALMSKLEECDIQPENITIQHKTNPKTLTAELTSEFRIDYSCLRNFLASGNWQEADRETLVVMLEATTRGKESSLDIESIANFPCADLITIDKLWLQWSNGRFGFSVQKRIWESLGRDNNKFGERVGWRMGWLRKKWINYSEALFNTSAPPGHLPLFGQNLGREAEENMLIFSLIARRLEKCEI